MKKTHLFLLAMTLSLTGCTSEFIRKNDERYLQPGALDPLLTGYYDVYQFKLLRQYKITHAWPLPARACKYRSLPTLNRGKDRYKGEIFAAPEIYESNNRTWQASNTGLAPIDFDRFVRPTYKRQIPEFGPGGIKTGRMLEKEETGLEPVCFEAWVGTSHAMSLMLYRRTLDDWQAVLGQWSQGSYVAPNSRKFVEDVSGNKWRVYRVELGPRFMNRIAGAFELRVLPIGQTNYTLALELAANQDSLQHPQAHANFQAVFRHLIESVRVEEIKP